MLNNEKVKIKEDREESYSTNEREKRKSSLYIAISDTIFIANIQDTYTRIQTICHECIHSIQPRRLLLFNFIYSNIYFFYIFISIILSLIGVFKDFKLQITIILILSFLYYVIRAYLETDAMTKARYLAEKYMVDYIEKNPICTKDEVEKIVDEYDKINAIGIPTYNYILLFNCIRNVGIFALIMLVKSLL